MTQIIKRYALFNESLNKFVKTGWPIQYADLDKAVMYKTIAGAIDGLNLVLRHTTGKVICVDVLITAAISESVDFKLALDAKRLKFNKLDKLANDDIDAMSEKQYLLWRKLKNNLADIGNI